jgi:hypothetical protein
MRCVLMYVRHHHIGLVALFLALGGTAYAASLPRNSVGPSQIKKNAVTSAKVMNRSLLARDFKRGQLPRGAAGRPGALGPLGPIGPRGATGPQGERGPSDAYGASFDDRTLTGDLAFLDLPAGNYLVTANAYLENPTTGDQTAVCLLADISYTGGPLGTYGGDGARVTVPGSGATPYSATLGLTLNDPSRMHFSCMQQAPHGAEPHMSAKDIDIGALQVGRFND